MTREERDETWEDNIEYETETVQLGDHSLKVTTVCEMSAGDALEMLLHLGEKETEISGQCVWVGSQIMCNYLLAFPEVVKGKRVVELGAGSGLCGMISAKCGSISTVLTDGDETACDLLKKNLISNDLVGQADVTRLFWGDHESMTAFTSSYTAPIDTLIAAEVLYKRCLVNPFFETAAKLLRGSASSESTSFYLCNIPRGGVTQAEVVDAAKVCGFDVEELPIDQSWMPTEEGSSVAVQDGGSEAVLYKFTLPPQ